MADASAVAAIGDYHVVLWTAILLVVVLLSVIYFMLAMGSEPLDPQLTVQVADSRKAGPGKTK